MTKSAIHVEPVSSGMSTHMHWVCDTLICPVSHAHTQGYDHLTYPLQNNSTVRSSLTRHKPDYIPRGGPYRLEIIYLSASTKTFITRLLIFEITDL